TIQHTLEVLYGYPSQKTIDQFLAVNAHLKGSWIRPGQMVIVTPENPGACTLWEQQMALAAQHVDKELEKLTAKERAALSQHYALLSNAATYSSTMYGWTNHYFAQK